MSFHPPTSTERNGRYRCRAIASFLSSLLLDIYTYHFTWWKLVDKNSVVSSYMDINAIINIGISLVTVGKKYLSNQNFSSESLCSWDDFGSLGCRIGECSFFYVLCLFLGSVIDFFRSAKTIVITSTCFIKSCPHENN